MASRCGGRAPADAYKTFVLPKTRRRCAARCEETDITLSEGSALMNKRATARERSRAGLLAHLHASMRLRVESIQLDWENL